MAQARHQTVPKDSNVMLNAVRDRLLALNHADPA